MRPTLSTITDLLKILFSAQPFAAWKAFAEVTNPNSFSESAFWNKRLNYGTIPSMRFQKLICLHGAIKT